MTNEELEHGSFEIENRIRNLMWTISGDYDLDTKPDVTSFYKSKYISIYDAINAGFGKLVFVIRKDFEQDFRDLSLIHI